MFRIAIWGMLAAVALVIGLSYIGQVHPAGDSFGVIRYPMVGVAMGLAALVYHRWVARAVLIAGCLLIGDRALRSAEWHSVDDPAVVLYQKNLLFRPADRGPFVADVINSQADIVTLQEVSRANRPILALLEDNYPHQQLCFGTAVGGVAILSRWPISARDCSDPAGIALAEVETPEGPLRVVALHLHWPWPYGQAEKLGQMLPLLDGLDPMRTVLGGDFNMVPWGYSLDRVEQALGVARIGHIERTFEVKGYPVTIDHVMAGPDADGTVAVRERLGSDHFGVLARIAFSGP